MPWLS